MEQDIEKAEKIVAFEIACKILIKGFDDMKYSNLNKLNREKLELRLTDIEDFAHSDWLVSICMIARIDDKRVRKEFDKRLESRFEHYNINREIEEVKNEKNGWECLSDLCGC